MKNIIEMACFSLKQPQKKKMKTFIYRHLLIAILTLSLQ